MRSDPEYVVVIFSEAVCVLQCGLRLADATHAMHSARVLAGPGVGSAWQQVVVEVNELLISSLESRIPLEWDANSDSVKRL